MYKEYDISGKGVPQLIRSDLLKASLKKFANKDYYDNLSISERDDKIDPYSSHGDSTRMRLIDSSDRKEIIRLLKKCFTNITFRLTGFFVYGPDDYMS